MTAHDAAGSALGYLYQVRWALVALARQSRARPDIAISLELLDDVAFEERGSATELLQLKHHATRRGHLGDMSVDVWKTLKVWLDGSASLRPDGPILSIVSTGLTAPGSALALLRNDARDPESAVDLLDIAARVSTNDETLAAREAWLALDGYKRFRMAERIYVHDGEVMIDEVDQLVRDELSLGAPFGHEELYYERVFEWWSKAAIAMLLGQRTTVSGIDLKARLSDIRDFFRADSLPTTVQLADVDENELADEYQDQNFVKQLNWINLNAVHLRKAVVDYHRAVTQTTKWLDNSLIGVWEIQEFEDNLVDEWERAFADMLQDLGGVVDGETRKQAGLTLFRALSASTSVTIRALYDEAFYARGKRHELANVGQVGWHPDFQDRLAALIGAA